MKKKKRGRRESPKEIRRTVVEVVEMGVIEGKETKRENGERGA